MNDRLYIFTAILRLLFQSTALFTNACAPLPKSRWNSIPLNNFAKSFCYSISNFWSASIVDLIVSFWMLILFLFFYFFFSNIYECLGMYFLPSILNLSLSINDFLLFFFCSFFNSSPLTHKSFLMCSFLVTTEEELAWRVWRKSWLLGRAVNAAFVWVWGKFDKTERRLR